MKTEKLDKLFKYIYYIVLTCIVGSAIYLTAVLIISPKNDLKNRGFIACTKKLVLNLSECKSGEIKCVFKSFFGDTVCNMNVVFDGFSAWIKGKQSTPWENYIFEPKWQEESENPYLSNPQEDMENMRLEREFILQKQQELENIKNKNKKSDVIIFDPENDVEDEIIEEEFVDEKVSDENQNISEEAFVEKIENDNTKGQKTEKIIEPKIMSNSKKIAEKAKNEVLSKENKNE